MAFIINFSNNLFSCCYFLLGSSTRFQYTTGTEFAKLFADWSTWYQSISSSRRIFLHIVPIQILHFIYPFGFGLLYAIFNITYFFITGDGVYEFVDWRDNLGPTIGTFIGTMVFIIIMHVVLFFIYLAKSRCANSHSRNVIV